MIGLILIFRIPSRDLKRLDFSGSVDPSPHLSAQPPSLSTRRTAVFYGRARSSVVPLYLPIVPTESRSTLNFTNHHPPHMRAQTSFTPEIDHPSTMAQSTKRNTPSQTSYDSGSESVSGANSNTINPLLRFTSKVFSLSTWAKLIIQTGINQPLSEVKPTGSDGQQAQSQYYKPIR